MNVSKLERTMYCIEKFRVDRISSESTGGGGGGAREAAGRQVGGGRGSLLCY